MNIIAITTITLVARGATQETGGSILYVFLCLGGLIFLGWMASPFLGGSSSSPQPTAQNKQKALQAIVRNENEYDEYLERDTFTNEEILSPGIDIRNAEHRRYIKDKRHERSRDNLTEEQQRNRAKWEERPRPDARSRSGYSREYFSTSEYLKMIQKMFPKANIQFSWNTFGGKDMEFTMRDRNVIEMTPMRGNRYRIIEIRWDKGRPYNHEIYNGNAEGAFEKIARWYMGE